MPRGSKKKFPFLGDGGFGGNSKPPLFPPLPSQLCGELATKKRTTDYCCQQNCEHREAKIVENEGELTALFSLFYTHVGFN